jgi:peptidoglycan hydrolase CwlO-like protein
MKLTITQRIAAAVAAGTMLVGVGATVAAAAPTPEDREAAVSERLAKLDCANADQATTKVEERAAKATTRISDRVAELGEMKAKVADAGREKIGARIQKRIDRLKERLDKIPAFVDETKTRIDEHCATAG